jgi:hypothetical protein
MIGIALVLGCRAFFFNFKRATILNFAKNVLPPLDPKLLVMWERIGEALKMVCSAYQFAETWY